MKGGEGDAARKSRALRAAPRRRDGARRGALGRAPHDRRGAPRARVGGSSRTHQEEERAIDPRARRRGRRGDACFNRGSTPKNATGGTDGDASETHEEEPKKPEEIADEDRASGTGVGSGIIFVVLLVATGALGLVRVPALRRAGQRRSRVEIDDRRDELERLADTLEKRGPHRQRQARSRGTCASRAARRRSCRATHLLTDDASPRELLHRLERRGASRAKIVIPEGWTRFDIAKRLHALARLHAARAFLDATTSDNAPRRAPRRRRERRGLSSSPRPTTSSSTATRAIVVRADGRTSSTSATRRSSEARAAASRICRDSLGWGRARDRDPRVDHREGGRGRRRAADHRERVPEPPARPGVQAEACSSAIRRRATAASS